MRMKKRESNIDIDYFLEISGGDREFIVHTVDEIIIALSESVEELENDYTNPDKVVEILHKIKPTLSYINAANVVSLCEKIQKASVSRSKKRYKTSVLNLAKRFQKIIHELEVLTEELRI